MQTSIQDMKNYIQGKANKALDDLGVLSKKIKEMAVSRAMKCPECLKNGKCLECGCKTPDMFYAPEKKCKKGRW